ncbi:MAG: redoxin family protein [Anditalea sp.]
MNYLSLVLLFLYSQFSVFAQDKKPELLELNAQAPDFNLMGVDDKYYSLANFEDKKLLAVIFTCNHCPTAQAYEDKIIKLVDDYRERGVGFVAISPNDPDAISLAELGYTDLNDDLEAMKIRAKNKNYNFPYLYDGETQETSIAYGPVATPHVFIFDRNRKLKYSGRIDDTENPYLEPKQKDMENALEAMLQNMEPEVATTKTFGCSVKWSWQGDYAERLKKQWAEEPVVLNQIGLEEINRLMTNEDGEKLRLVNIWATWCGPCIIEFPDFVDINRMYRDRDFEFISLSADKMGNEENALDFLKKKEASNMNYIFSGEDIYDLIEVVDKDWQGSLPYTALVDPEGKVLYKVEGTIDPGVLKTKIVDYLGRFYADN